VQKVQSHDLVKVLLQECVVVQVNTIVQLRKLEYHVYDLWLVGARQAIVLLSVKYSLRALVNHLWTY
jgi:hypothetical protein